MMPDKDPTGKEDFADVNDEEISGRADEDEEFEDTDDVDEEEDEDDSDV
jgi:hypothetical protein